MFLHFSNMYYILNSQITYSWWLVYAFHFYHLHNKWTTNPKFQCDIIKQRINAIFVFEEVEINSIIHLKVIINLLFVPILAIVERWVRNFIPVSFAMFLVLQMGPRIGRPRRFSEGVFKEACVMVFLILFEETVQWDHGLDSFDFSLKSLELKEFCWFWTFWGLWKVSLLCRFPRCFCVFLAFLFYGVLLWAQLVRRWMVSRALPLLFLVPDFIYCLCFFSRLSYLSGFSCGSW